MTQNQVAYQANLIREKEEREKERSNRENERIKAHEAQTKRSSYELERKLAPYKAYEMEMSGRAKQSGRFQDITKGIKNIIGAATGLGALFG